MAFNSTRFPEEIEVESVVATFRAMFKTRFDRLDIDDDGYLSKNEYLFLSRLPRIEQESSNQNGEGTASSPEPDGLPPLRETPLDVAQIEFRIFDTDKDERISWEEMMAFIEVIYIFDTNEDGKVTRSEWEEFYKTRMGGERESNEEE